MTNTQKWKQGLVFLLAAGCKTCPKEVFTFPNDRTEKCLVSFHVKEDCY